MKLKGKNKYMKYAGLEIIKRPYNKPILIISILIACLGVLPFLPFFITVPLATKLLFKFG